MINKLLLLFIVSMPFYSSPSLAAPDGADLLAACEHSLQHDFQDVKGKLCQWYVMPCDCHHGRKPPPRVCLPSSVAIEILAQQVITGLEAKPALQSEDADMAAAIILAEHYPCSDND